MKKNIDLLVIGTLRAGRDFTDLVNERIGAGVVWKLGKYIELSPVYRRIAAQPVEGRTVQENRFTFEAELEVPVGRFVLEQRNRIERRFFDAGATTNYRNRVKLQYPVKFFNGGINLFWADEVFYDWKLNSWFRNRVAVGGEKALSKRFLLEIYYLRQNDGVSLPGDLHVIGLTLEVSP